ncbi:MAG: filamentous hemagglutinin N-terminal domain-containing protein, partial [Candidatus Omnitrophica bacterium]|nr:filamentous hemagglutinin N-terminal domain-containing protein [Candidatus Omnitrophota bacterium]MBU1923317.1 filamentous hemagglutinin N-terminal domain-containing protein [Candidatus Omnitrophota bacterium]
MVIKAKNKINKFNPSRAKLGSCAIPTLAIFIFFLIFPFSVALSADLPENPMIQAGNPSISSDGRDMIINAGQYSKTWVDWAGGFNIGTQNSVNNIGPDASAIMLHRDISGAISDIAGVLKGNCNVFLLNANGILFAPGAQINVGGLVASTLQMSLEDFVSGDFVFNSGGANLGSIVNAGSITAYNPGGVTLIAGAVRNEGVISANLGTVNLVSGQEITLDVNGEGSIQATVNKTVLDNVYDKDGNKINVGVENTGIINVDGGQVYIAVEAVKDVFDNLINQEGVIKAGSMVQKEGKIVLVSNSDGIVQNTGTLDASAVEPGAKGGTVHVLGEKVGLFGNAKIDVSGDAGGGTVLVGGDYQGKNPDVRNATAIYMGPNTSINADAINNGDGGKIILWSDNSTKFYGALSANGGREFGDGGLVETSSHNYLDALGQVSANASNGKSGTWLLDPWNVDIALADSNGAWDSGSPNTFTPSNSPSTADRGQIQTSINAGTSVTVQTLGGGGGEAGDITMSQTITTTGTATLTLNAVNDLTVGQTITASSGVLTLILTADADGSGAGALSITSAVTTNGGSATLISGTDITISAGLDVGVGNITIRPSLITTSIGVATAAQTMDIPAAAISNLTSTGTVTIGATNNTGGITIGTDGAVAGGAKNFTFNQAAAGNITTGGSALTTTGNVTLNADTLVFGAGGINANNITYQPVTAGTQIGIASAAWGDTDFLTDAALDLFVTTGTLTIGSTSNAGGIKIGTDGAVGQGAKNLDFITTGTLTEETNGLSTTGNITFTVDQIDLTQVGAAVSGAAITIKPATSGTTIAVDDATGTLSITDAELDTITATGTMAIGSATAGAINIGSANSITQDEPLTFDTNGANITLDGNITTSGGSTITFSDPVVINEAATITVSTGAGVAGDILFSGAIDGTAGGVAENLTLISGTGATTITGAIGGTDPLGALALQSNTGTETGTITFNGNVTAATVTTYGQAYAVAFNEDATITNDCDFLNTGTITLGNGADDILTFTGGLSTTTGPSGTNAAGTINTTDTRMDIGAVTLTAATTFDTGNNAAGILNVGAITSGGFALVLDSGSTAGATIGVTSMADISGGLTIRDAGGLAT